MQHHAALDGERLENLLTVWTPIATGGPLKKLKCDRRGNVSTELDMDVPVKAANIVLQAIRGRVQLLTACQPEILGKDGAGTTNVLVWLSQVLPGVQKIVNGIDGMEIAHPKQILELESEAEFDVNANGAK
jgi:hypothetical protein